MTSCLFDGLVNDFNTNQNWLDVLCTPNLVLQVYLVLIIEQQWIVPQFLNLRPKMAKSIVYVITLITNRNHAFNCLN